MRDGAMRHRISHDPRIFAFSKDDLHFSDPIRAIHGMGNSPVRSNFAAAIQGIYSTENEVLACRLHILTISFFRNTTWRYERMFFIEDAVLEARYRQLHREIHYEKLAALSRIHRFLGGVARKTEKYIFRESGWVSYGRAH